MGHQIQADGKRASLKQYANASGKGHCFENKVFGDMYRWLKVRILVQQDTVEAGAQATDF